MLPSRLLEDQHRRIDQGLEAFLDDSGHLQGLADALSLLRLHVYLEEGILFPHLEKAGLTMPVLVMKREHGQMWPLIQTLAAGCASDGPAGSLHETCRALLRLLANHNPKEEQVLYSAADRLDAQPTAGSLTQALEAGRMPEGWACIMAPR